MKTKITSFVALCLLMMISMSVKAQSIEEYGTPLITDVSQFYDNQYGDASEGTVIANLIDGDASTFWHTDWHGASHPDTEHHWLPVHFDNPVSGNLVVWMTRRSASDDHPTKMLVKGSNDGNTWTDITEVELPYSGSGTTTQSNSFTVATPYSYLEFAASDCAGTQNLGCRIYWHCAEFQLYQVTDHTMELQAQLSAILTTYDSYLYGEEGGGTSFHIGTAVGEYSDAAANQAFLAALQRVYNILDGSEDMPDDEGVEALINEVKEQYNKVLASEVLFKLAHDGYYRIKGTMQYYESVQTGVDENDDPVYEKQNYHDVAMYSMLEGYGAWGPYDTTDCRQVWKLEQKEDGIKMVNAGTDLQFSTFGSPVTMAAADTLVAFDWVGNENGHDVIEIRMAGAARDKTSSTSVYLHQWGHTRGNRATPYYLCVWENTYNMGDMYDSDKGTSEWYLEEVSDEEAAALIEAYEPVKNHDVLVIRYDELLAKAKAAVAISKEEASAAQVTENSQFHSWCTETAEGSINNLLDGNSSTFWHSAWTGGSVAMHSHGIDVILPEAETGDFKAWVQRRGSSTNDDNVVKFSVYTANDESALNEDGSEEGWTKVADLTLPWSSGVMEVYSEQTFTIAEPSKYLRFYCDETTGPTSGNVNRGYFHMGGFNVYKITGTQQLAGMGEVGTNMIAAIEAGDALDRDAMTIADLNSLQAVYDAFMAVLVDPTEMRSAITSNLSATADYVESENPGCYSNSSTKDALEAIVKAATEYNNLGSYTKEECASYVEKINAAVAAYKAARNPISTGKWYKFRHMDAETFPGIATNGASAIYGQYVAVADQTVETTTDENGDEVTTKTNNILATDDMRPADNLFFVSAEAAEANPDAVMFRFVQVSDSTYAIQNKATGLYISRDNDGILMMPNPIPVTVKTIGYGQQLLVTYNFDGSTFSYPNLNCWAGNGNQLMWWSDTTPGCNSAFEIETVEDVEDGFTSQFNMDAAPGMWAAMTSAVSLQPAEGEGELYDVVGTFEDGGVKYVGVKSIEKSQPGAPCLYIYGDPSEYNEESDELVTVPFTAGSEINMTPSTDGCFVGTYVEKRVDPGYIVFNNNKATVTTAQDNEILAGSGYVIWGQKTITSASECDMAIAIDGTIEDGIKSAMANVAKAGTVYNVAGQVVRTNATLNDMKNLGTGIYILNGTKVMVK